MRIVLLDMIWLGLLITGCYLIWLGTFPLFVPDEGRYAEVAREMLSTHDYIIPHLNGTVLLDKPVLHYWFTVLGMKLWGETEWGVRFFTAISGIMGCIFTYCYGYYVFNRLTGIIAAVLLATSPLYFLGSHYANLDLEVAVLISGTLFCSMIAISSSALKRYYFGLLSCVFAAAAFLCKGLIGIALPSIIIGGWVIFLQLWKQLKSELQVWHILSGVGLFLLIVLPWYCLVQYQYPSFFRFFFIHEQVMRFLSALPFNNQQPFWFYIPVLYFGFFPWSIFIIQAVYQGMGSIRDKEVFYKALFFLLLWIFLIVSFFSIPHSKTIGYIYSVFPALALIVGYYLAQSLQSASDDDPFNAIHFMVTTGLWALALWLSWQQHWIIWPKHFLPYLKYIIIVTGLSSMILFSLLCLKKVKRRFFIIFCSGYNIVWLLLFIHGAAFFNPNSVKSLALVLKPMLRLEDQVVAYFNGYHDLAFYLKQPIFIVQDWNNIALSIQDNWATALWRGMKLQKESQSLLLNRPALKKMWNAPQSLFILVDEHIFPSFKNTVKKYYILARDKHTILLSNHPQTLPGTVSNIAGAA